MPKHRIAILIPCYNSAGYLPDLFDGISKQSVAFDEIICYDDASSDNTIEIAEQLGAKVIIGTENKGPAYARNRLLNASTCEYIHFHDSDDLIDTDFVRIMHEQIENEDTQFICNTYVLDRTTRSHNLGNITYENLLTEPDQLAYFIENVGFASMGLYSKKALADIGGFREDLQGNEDPDLHIRLSEKGYVIKPVKQFLITKLEHLNSFSHQNWFRCLSDKLLCLETYYSVLDKKYEVLIGKQAAELSNFFYREKDPVLSKRARYLAYKCGTNSITSSKFSRLVSTTCGLPFYLWLYRRRVDLNMI